MQTPSMLQTHGFDSLISNEGSTVREIEEMVTERSEDVVNSFNLIDDEWELLKYDHVIQTCYELVTEDPGTIHYFAAKGWVGSEFDWIIRAGLVWLNQYTHRSTFMRLMAISAVESAVGAANVVIYTLRCVQENSLSEDFNVKASLFLTIIRGIGNHRFPSRPLYAYNELLKVLNLSPQLTTVCYSRLFGGTSQVELPIIH